MCTLRETHSEVIRFQTYNVDHLNNLLKIKTEIKENHVGDVAD